MGPSSRIRGVLLDIDGTLVDSNDAHAWAWEQALREAGHDVAFTRIRPLMGMGGDKVIAALTTLSAGDRRARALGEARTKIFLGRWLAQVRPQPGARQLVLALRARNYRIAIATAARADEASALLRIAGVDDLVGEPLTSSEVKSSKPDPDVVCAGLDRLGLPACETVLVGDTRFDVQAAAQAAVATIGLLCGGARPEALHGAIALYRDPAALAARLRA